MQHEGKEGRVHAGLVGLVQPRCSFLLAHIHVMCVWAIRMSCMYVCLVMYVCMLRTCMHVMCLICLTKHRQNTATRHGGTTNRLCNLVSNPPAQDCTPCTSMSTSSTLSRLPRATPHLQPDPSSSGCQANRYGLCCPCLQHERYKLKSCRMHRTVLQLVSTDSATRLNEALGAKVMNGTGHCIVLLRLVRTRVRTLTTDYVQNYSSNKFISAGELHTRRCMEQSSE